MKSAIVFMCNQRSDRSDGHEDTEAPAHMGIFEPNYLNNVDNVGNSELKTLAKTTTSNKDLSESAVSYKDLSGSELLSCKHANSILHLEHNASESSRRKQRRTYDLELRTLTLTLTLILHVTVIEGC